MAAATNGEMELYETPTFEKLLFSPEIYVIAHNYENLLNLFTALPLA